jgi:amidase
MRCVLLFLVACLSLIQLVAFSKGAILGDGGTSCMRELEASGEPLIEGLHLGAPDTALSLSDSWQINARRTTYQQEYLKHWNSTVNSTDTGRPVDAIICPVAPFPAPPHGCTV